MIVSLFSLLMLLLSLYFDLDLYKELQLGQNGKSLLFAFFWGSTKFSGPNPAFVANTGNR